MIEPLNVAGALRRSWRLLAALAVVFALIAVLLPVSHAKPTGTKKAKWTAAAIIGAPPTAAIGNTSTSVQTILYYANNFFVKDTAVAAAGYENQLGLLAGSMSGTASALGQGLTTATTKPVRAAKAAAAPVVTLLAGGTTAQRAANLAQAYVTSVLNSVNQAYQSQLANAGSPDSSADSGVTLVSPAFASTAVKTGGTKAGLGASRKVRGLIGLLIGLLLGAGIVLLREMMDRTVRSAGRAERVFRYPVVAEIPSPPLRSGVEVEAAYPVEVVGAPDSSSAEAYRMLRMSVLFEPLAAGALPADEFSEDPTWQLAAAEPYERPEAASRQVVLVVSAGNERTRPEVAANLGATYAEAGQRAIVISTADISSGYAPDSLPHHIGPLSASDLAARLEPSSLPNVSRLSLRHFVGSSGQLVTLGPELLNSARQLADVVIVETPPLLVVHHGEALIHSVDVVVVVAECGSTTIDQGRRASEILRRLGAPVLGLVLTKLRLPRNDIRQTNRPGGTTSASQVPMLESGTHSVHEVTQA